MYTLYCWRLRGVRSNHSNPPRCGPETELWCWAYYIRNVQPGGAWKAVRAEHRRECSCYICICIAWRYLLNTIRVLYAATQTTLYAVACTRIIDGCRQSHHVSTSRALMLSNCKCIISAPLLLPPGNQIDGCVGWVAYVMRHNGNG